MENGKQLTSFADAEKARRWRTVLADLDATNIVIDFFA